MTLKRFQARMYASVVPLQVVKLEEAFATFCALVRFVTIRPVDIAMLHQSFTSCECFSTLVAQKWSLA